MACKADRTALLALAAAASAATVIFLETSGLMWSRCSSCSDSYRLSLHFRELKIFWDSITAMPSKEGSHADVLQRMPACNAHLRAPLHRISLASELASPARVDS